MTTVGGLHREAMRIAQSADLERDADRKRALMAEALPFELRAVERIAKEPASEPTRSILYLSAASLARLAGLPERARELVNEGLSGWPPPRTENDLNEFLAMLDAEAAR